MPSFCVVADCEYKYAQSASISFHKYIHDEIPFSWIALSILTFGLHHHAPFRFPFHTASLLHQWIAFTERGPLWQPSRWSSICSRHFQATDYRDHLFRKCLKRTAVPTVRARPTFEFVDTPMQCEAVVDQQKTADESFTVSPTTTETSNNEQEHMSINPSTLQMPSRTQPSSPTLQIQQPQTSESHCILLQNCRLCARSDPNSHHLDETAIATAIQKCCPTVHLDMDVRLSRQVCSECVIELNSFVQFIDRIVSTETELQRRLCSTSPSINTASASVAPPVTNITDSVAITTVVAAKPTATPAIGVNRQHSIQSTQPAKLLHIKQEPSLLLANVKQEFVDRTTAGAAAIASTATMTPNGISMMTATTFDIANCDLPAVPLMQPVKYAPCQEIQPDNDAFCEFCDVYFINNLELKTHIVNYHNSTTSENAHEDTTSSYPNNCEIMEIITLENAFINLAEEAEQPEACGNEVLQDHHNLVVSEDMIPLERVLKVEHFNDYEQREQHSLVIRREHSYCRRSDGRFASITIPDGGDLKQEIKSTELVSEMPIPQHHLPPQNQPTQCLVPLIKCTECTETFGTAHQKLAHHYRVHRGISSSQLRRRHRLPTILHCTNCAQRFGSKVAWRNHRNVCERWYRMLTRFLRAHGSLRTRVLGRLRSAIAGRILAVRRRRATNDRATKDDDRFECRSCGRSYVQYESYVSVMADYNHPFKR